MAYEYQLKDENLDFEKGVGILKQNLKNKVIIGAINNTEPDNVKSVCNELKKIGIPVESFRVDKNAFLEYMNKGQYKVKYPEYYKDNSYEKTLEHFLCFKMINLKKGDRFVDIASEYSPAGEIFQNLSNCSSYSQDIMYKPGIHENKIGSNASNIPVPDNFFNAAVAICSMEHFENNSDIKFMKEMERVLMKNGKIVIVPLYLHTTYSCQTDPQYSIPGNVSFDENADIYCAEGWENRYGRFYSPSSLYERLIKPNKNINFKVYLLENPEEIDSSIYCRYVLVGTKTNNNETVSIFNYEDYPKKLNIACGFDIMPGYLNVDFKSFHKPDLIADIRNLSMLPSDRYEEILAQDCLEHFPRCDTKPALKEWYRLLKKGGLLKIRTVNLTGLLELFLWEEKQSIERQEELVQCLFGTQAYNGDFHLTGFTRIVLEHYLKETGFGNLKFQTKDHWLFDIEADKL